MIVGLALALSAGLIAGPFHHTVGAAPILAALLCASCFLRRRDVAVVGLGSMLVHDLLVGVSAFTLVRMVGIAAVIGIVWLARVGPTLKSLLIGLMAASPVYHLVLSTGDWALQFCSKAPLTPQGFWATLTSNLPYVQRSLVSEVLFTSAFLSLYALAGYLVTLRWPSLLPQPSKG